MLRDIKDNAVGNLSTRASILLQSLKGMEQRLREMAAYLGKVESGELPVNHPILYNLQSIFNLLPDTLAEGLVKSQTVTTNDQLMVVYLSSLVRAIISLDHLIGNKLENREAEKPAAKKDKNGQEVANGAAASPVKGGSEENAGK